MHTWACARLGKESGKKTPKTVWFVFKQVHGIETSVQVEQQIKKKIGKTDLNDEQPPGAPYTASTDKILASLLQYVYI